MPADTLDAYFEINSHEYPRLIFISLRMKEPDINISMKFAYIRCDKRGLGTKEGEEEKRNPQ